MIFKNKKKEKYIELRKALSYNFFLKYITHKVLNDNLLKFFLLLQHNGVSCTLKIEAQLEKKFRSKELQV
jgi:hypothetical protein